MKVYVVLDTNVIVSALITKNDSSPTIKILKLILQKNIVPLYHIQIIEEYNGVLGRPKFNLDKTLVNTIIKSIMQNGIEVNPGKTEELLPDEDDTIFYEVVMDKREDNAYLITGNIKHFPVKPFIVTPSEFIKIIEEMNI